MDISVFIAVCRELADALPGARIVEASEGGSGEICLTLKGRGEKRELVICPRPDMPRIYLTSSRPCRMKSLTPSAQAIRNRIIGLSVVSVEQAKLERAANIKLAGKEPGETYTLVYEMAGKKPNLIVLDEQGRVAAAQTYTPISEEALRPVLPGLKYEPPPLPDRLDPSSVTAEDIEAALRENPGLAPGKALFMRIGGLSPLLAREVAARAGDGADSLRLMSELETALEQAANGPYSPRIIDTPKGPVLAAFELAQYAGLPREPYRTMSEAAEAYYALVAGRRLIEDTRRRLLKDVNKRLDAARRRLGALTEDMARSENAEVYTRYGNLIMAQLADVPEGASEARLTDLFSEDGAEITVPLDPRLNPVKNAGRYFQKARKAASGARLVAKRLEETRKEVDELEALSDAVSHAATMEELVPFAGGPPAGAGKKAKQGRPAARHARFPSFTSSDGYEVLYAKNAKSNDTLTFKLAEPMDLWLHAQGYHGAHVIVRNPDRRPDIPLNTILEAASAAAWYSEARKDSSVAVDYTFRKYVRKPRDPVPGQAVFTQNKTVFVKPMKPPGRDLSVPLE